MNKWVSIILISAVPAVIVTDCASGRWEKAVPAVVIERVYVPRKTAVGVGNTFNSDGTSGTIVTSSTEAEQWLVIAQLMDERVLKVRARPEQWAQCQKGAEIHVRNFRGRITNLTWTWQITSTP